MSSYEIKFNLTPAQEIVAGDHSKFRMLRAGRAYGKSYLIRKLAVLDCLTFPRTDVKPVVTIAAQHNTQLTQIHWLPLVNDCETIYAPLVKRIHKTGRRIEWLDSTKPDLILRGLGQGRLGDNLRGLSFYRTYLDESQDIALTSLLDDIIMPRMEVPGSQVTMCFTPKGYLNDTYRVSQREGVSEHHFTSYDNPYRDPAEIDALKLVLPPRTFSQEILANYENFDAQVFTEFDRAQHVTSIERRPEVMYVGLDHGSINPAVVLIGVFQYGERLHAHVYDSWRNTTGEPVVVDTVIAKVREYVEKCRELTGTVPFRVFSPDDRRDVEVSLRRAGVPHLKTVCRSNPGPIARMALMNRLFYVGALTLCDDDTLADEVQSYRRKVVTGVVQEAPDDGQEDHRIDAIAYTLGQIAHKQEARFCSF